MKVVSRYCDSCGIKIPATDIRDGRAFKFEDSFFCGDCKDEILPIIKRSREKVDEEKEERRRRRGRSKGKDGGKKARKKRKKKKKKKKKKRKKKAKKKRKKKNRKRKKKGSPSRGEKDRRRGRGGKRKVRKRRSRDVRRRSREDDEEGEGIPEYRPRSTPVARLAIIGGGLLLLLLILAGLMLVTETDSGPEGTRQAEVKELLGQEELAAIMLDEAESWASEHPDAHGEAIARYRAVARFAAGTSVAADANAAARGIEERRENAARDAFHRIQESVEDHLEEHRFDEALAAIEEFPGPFLVTGWAEDLRRLKERVRRERAAKRDADQLVSRARDLAGREEWQRAQGVLHAFPDEYRDLPAYRRVTTARDTVREQRAAAARAAEEREEAARRMAAREEEEQEQEEARQQALEEIASVEPEPQIGADLLNWNIYNTAQNWDLENGVLIGEARDNVNILGTGRSTWRDMVVEFEFQVVRGSFKLGVRARMIRQGEQQGIAGTVLEVRDSAEHPAGQWHRIRVLVQGDRYALIEGDLGPDAELEPLQPLPQQRVGIPQAPTGGFMFVLDPNSEVRFREAQVRVLREAERR